MDKFFETFPDLRSLESIIQFLSNNFELLIYCNIAFLIMVAVVWIILYLQDRTFREWFFPSARMVLGMLLITGQVGLLFVFFHLFWVNYKSAPERFSFPDDIAYNTRWVKDRIALYFIDRTKLYTIDVQGKSKELLFEASDNIIEYHFSHDGKQLLVNTEKELHLVNRKSKKSRRIDQVNPDPSQSEVKGIISGIRWAPDNEKFCYEVSRWSQFATQDKVYVYLLNTDERKEISSPVRKISSLYWDKLSENLYYLSYESREKVLQKNPYDVNVYKVPLTQLSPEFVAHIPYKETQVPLKHLLVRDIELDLDADQLSFGRREKREVLKNETGKVIGIDEEDYLYYVPNQWFKKRLFKIDRYHPYSEIPRHRYTKGDLVVDNIRWLPGGKYVIMNHKKFGVLIVDPLKRRVGALIGLSGHTFGWYNLRKP